MKTTLNNSIVRRFGQVFFWLTWPALLVRLGLSRRVRVAVVHDGKVLLLRRWYSAGSWQLPGGGLKRGEEAVTAACRELSEELGWSPSLSTLQHIDDSRLFWEYGILYHVELYVARTDIVPAVTPLERGVLSLEWVPVDQAAVEYAMGAASHYAVARLVK